MVDTSHRTTLAQRRRNVTRLLVRVIARNYGNTDKRDNTPWVTDEVASIARTLRTIAPRNGW